MLPRAANISARFHSILLKKNRNQTQQIFLYLKENHKEWSFVIEKKEKDFHNNTKKDKIETKCQEEEGWMRI